ncbi:hypothetical protein BYT27DRAFT_7191566 [Phlegmacium glaucopus]|nr:hypothetical protein BYT27DRAFT_7191566 [Phlegmacium glaucopus]
MNIAASSIPNFEEAASVASEFIASLDNLPNEVQHLLQEIKLKEQRCQEIQQDIAKDQSKYIKSSLKQYSSLQISTTASVEQSKSATASPTPNGSNSKAHLPGRISAAYAEVEALSNEKISIARQIIELLTRTRARLDGDLSRVRILQGESPEDSRLPVFTNVAHQLPLSSPHGTKRYAGSDGSVIGISPIIQIGESLRTAAGVGNPDMIHSMPAASGPGYNKKRRLTTTTSIKLPSPAPMIPSTTHHTATTHSRSRLSRQSHAVRVQQQEEEDLDADADGDEDVEGDDAEEDLTLYCFCHKQSYGDMIGCDNSACPYQWFHISCVGVKTPLPDKWYCPECIKTKNAASERRKSRKK